MGEKMRRFIREQSNKEADEIMAMIDADSEMADVHAPDEMEAALFARIDAYEESKRQRSLSEEEQELIELGKVFKKRRKARKYVAVAAIAVMAMTFGGVTVMGGPEKVMEKVERLMAGREQTRVNSDDERIEGLNMHNEEEAYEQVNEKFGFYPVRLNYLPMDMKFLNCEIFEEAQFINFIYQNEDGTIMYVMRPNYKIGSTANDIEDKLISEKVVFKDNITILVKEYVVEESKENRWVLEYEYENIFYFLQIFNVSSEEVNKVINDLHFP